MKNVLKKMFPESFTRFVYGTIFRNYLVTIAFLYDRYRYLSFSDSYRQKNPIELIGNIIKHYHVVEKGLTMPNPRLGFGQENLLKLIGECILFISSYGENDIQLKHAVAVIMEYYNFHLVNNHTLPSNVLDAIMKIQPHFAGVKSSVQKEISCDDYFAMIGNKFDTFSKSRASVRNFSDKSISIECLKSAIELSRNTPSACNRQPWRVYVYSDAKKIQAILNTQGGSRGFGNLSNKLIVIAGELGVFGHSFERNQVFVDCGMYAMNLLYSLHFHRIAACILNGNTTPSKDKILRKLCGFKDSEVLIAMIACGSPPEHFKLATSPRYEIDHFITVEH